MPSITVSPFDGAPVLIVDVMAVLDQLTPMAMPDHREHLIIKVMQACESQGTSHPLLAITQAVDQHLACVSSSTVTPTVSASGRVRAWANRIRTGVAPWWARKKPWRERPAWAGVVLNRVALGMAAAATLIWMPWTLFFQAPLVLAAYHVTFFLFTCLTTLVASGACALYFYNQICADRSTAPAFFWIPLGLFAGSILWLISGGIAYTLAIDTDDAQGLLNDANSYQQAYAQARASVAPNIQFGALIEQANEVMEKNKSIKTRIIPTMTNFGGGAIERKANLNPAECQLLSKLNPVFTVASINGNPVANLATACSYHWDNEVIIRSLPGKL